MQFANEPLFLCSIKEVRGSLIKIPGRPWGTNLKATIEIKEKQINLLHIERKRKRKCEAGGRKEDASHVPKLNSTTNPFI